MAQPNEVVDALWAMNRAATGDIRDDIVPEGKTWLATQCNP